MWAAPPPASPPAPARNGPLPNLESGCTFGDSSDAAGWVCDRRSVKMVLGAPPRATDGGSQLVTMLHKNWTLKKRAWKTSLCELFSPAIFLSLLVLA